MQIGSFNTGGGDWFKPAEHSSALALLIEPLGIVTKNIKGSDVEVLSANIWEFPTMESLSAGEPVAYSDVAMTQRAIVNGCRDREGMLIGPFRLGQKPSKNGNPMWVANMLAPSDTGYAEAVAFMERMVSASEASVPPMPA